MTPEQIAEARQECDVISETAPEALVRQMLVKALDALEAAERERDEALRDLHKQKVDDGRHLYELTAERNTARTRLAEVERERGAYAKAKAENDERFLTERDAALVRLAEVERERDEAWQESRTYAFKGGTSAAERDEALDRLAEVENERDELRTEIGKALCGNITAYDALIKERDTARAQVATLTEALRWYGNIKHWDPVLDSLDDSTFNLSDYEGNLRCEDGSRARAALKAAGVEP